MYLLGKASSEKRWSAEQVKDMVGSQTTISSKSINILNLHSKESISNGMYNNGMLVTTKSIGKKPHLANFKDGKANQALGLNFANIQMLASLKRQKS